jgi:dihydroorotate dehydrogenase
VGGVFTGSDAFEKLAAGASLVQTYTGFVYGGPAFARNINLGLKQQLESNEYPSIDELVGTGVQQ